MNLQQSAYSVDKSLLQHGELSVTNAHVAPVDNPIILGRITVIKSGVRKNARFVVERVCRRFADRARFARRIESVRLERVAAAEAELIPSTAVTKFATARSRGGTQRRRVAE